MGRKKTRCEECKKKKATHYCPECGFIVCEDCRIEFFGECPECSPPPLLRIDINA